MIAPATAIAVKSAAGASISAGVWTLVGVGVTGLISTLGLVAVAYIKNWGPWRKIVADERADDFARLRADIDRHALRISELEKQIASANSTAREASEHATRSDAKLQTALTACELLMGLVEREMPDAPEIGIVKRLLAQAASADMGVGDGFRKIAGMAGGKR